MVMTWRRPEGKQEARKREGIFQQEEACGSSSKRMRSLILLYSGSFFMMQPLVASF